MSKELPFAKKVFLMIGILTLLRILLFIPLPGVDSDSSYLELEESSKRFTITSLGLVPLYVTFAFSSFLVSTVSNEAQAAIPEESFEKTMRFVLFICACVCSYWFTLELSPYIMDWSLGLGLKIGCSLVTGFLLIWMLLEIFRRRGFPAGLGFVISVQSIDNSVQWLLDLMFEQDYGLLFFATCFFCLLVCTVCFFESLYSLVIIISAKDEFRTSVFPVKVGGVGVGPLVLVGSVGWVGSFLGNLVENETMLSIILVLWQAIGLFMITIVIFFQRGAESVSFSKTLEQMGFKIPNIRQGKDTVLYFEQLGLCHALLSWVYLFSGSICGLLLGFDFVGVVFLENFVVELIAWVGYLGMDKY